MDGGNKAKAAGGQPAAKGGKGKPAPAPDPYGKGPPTHQGAGGGGSSVWRDNLRCMWQSYNPEMPFNVWQRNLVVYSQQVTDLVLGKHESHRQFFARLKDKVDPGQVSLLLGLDSLPLVFLFFAGWTAWLGSCVFSSRLDSLLFLHRLDSLLFLHSTGWTAFFPFVHLQSWKVSLSRK